MTKPLKCRQFLFHSLVVKSAVNDYSHTTCLSSLWLYRDNWQVPFINRQRLLTYYILSCTITIRCCSGTIIRNTIAYKRLKESIHKKTKCRGNQLTYSSCKKCQIEEINVNYLRYSMQNYSMCSLMPTAHLSPTDQ